MSPILHNPLTNSTHRILKFYSPHITTHLNPIRTPKFHPSYYNPSSPFPPIQTSINNFPPIRRDFCIKAYDSSSSTPTFEEYERPNRQFSFDALLTALESIFVISSMVISIGCVLNWVFFKHQNLRLLELGNRVLVFFLAGAVALGSVIRSRQWRRVCGVPTSKSKLDSGNGNVVERIEKLEESMKSANTIIRMMSRQLEKLGVRFRLHRKALKEPIAETAALAQKNSEATRALAAQADILEKELTEVQKFLLAMQDQQQKQVDLILAIAKSGGLVDTKQEAASQGQVLDDKSSAEKSSRQVDGQPIQTLSGHKIATNDVAL